MEVRCTSKTDKKGREFSVLFKGKIVNQCNKHLGTPEILIGKLYCKSCGKANYYEVVTPEGLQKLKTL